MKTTLPTFYIFCASMMTLGFSSIAQAELSTCGGTPYVKTASKTVKARGTVKVDLGRVSYGSWDDPVGRAKETENLVRLCNERNQKELEKLDKALKETANKFNKAREECLPLSQQGGATTVRPGAFEKCTLANNLYLEYGDALAAREVRATELQNTCNAKKAAAANACDNLQARIRAEFGAGRRAEQACSARVDRLNDPTHYFTGEFGPLCELRNVNLRVPGLEPTGSAGVYGEQDLFGNPAGEEASGCTVPKEMIIDCEGEYDATALCHDELPQCPPALELDGTDIPDHILGQPANLFE
ncbi:MAG: hypothetical protein ACO3XO_07105 [Bdellovibrionota bacterium]